MHFRMTSFADNFEDVLLRRAFPDLADGFYIDVGAYDPVDHSVTKHFYDAGWRGINIEPNPAPHAKLVAGRDRDVNLKLGLSDHEGVLRLFEAPNACWSVDPDMLTGYFGADAKDIVEHQIPVTTLAKLCEQYVPVGRTIDFLKIDVEGHERAVIAGGDWSRWRPRIVLAEANGAETWEPMLLASGYQFAFFDGVNRFFVREEEAHLIARIDVPVNAGDCFLIHGYMQRINELEQSLGEFSDVGPVARAVAGRLRRAALRFPRAARVAKNVVRRLTA